MALQLLGNQEEFTKLLIATLDPASNKEAERRLRELEEAQPPEFMVACARELAATGKHVLSRHVGGLLMKNMISGRQAGVINRQKAELWKSMPEATRNAVRDLLIVALQDTERAVASTAAIIVAKIAAKELGESQSWDALVVQIRQWAEGSASALTRVTSLQTMGYIAEEWWRVFVQECHVQGYVHCMANTVAACMAAGQPVEVQVAAIEALFYLLGLLQTDLASNENSAALINSIVNHCHFNPSANPDLPIAALRCLGRLISGAPQCRMALGAQVARMAEFTVTSVQNGAEEISAGAIEFWTCLAEVEYDFAEEGTTYTQQTAPAMLPCLLEALCKEDPGDELSLLQDSIGAYLAAVMKSQNTAGLEIVASVLEKSFLSTDPKLRHAALIIFGSIMDGPADKAAPAVERYFQGLFPLLEDPSHRRSAALVAGLALERCPSAVPAQAKAMLLSPCLALLRDRDWSHDFEYVLQGLFGCLTLAPEQFASAARELCGNAVKGTDEECGAFLRCLSTLIVHAGGSSTSLLRELLLELLRFAESRRDKQVDGVGSCLQAITEHLGHSIADVASEMMRLYLSILQLNAASGGCFHDETLQATKALVVVIGPHISDYMVAFWPVLKAAMASIQYPSTVQTAFGIFGDVARALGANVAPYATEAMQVAAQLIENPECPMELKPSAATCFGVLGLTLGGQMPCLSDFFGSLHGLARIGKGIGKGEKGKGTGKKGKGKGEKGAHWKGHGKGKGKGKQASELCRVTDDMLHRRAFMSTLAQVTCDVMIGLKRTDSLRSSLAQLHVLLVVTASMATFTQVADDLRNTLYVLGLVAAEDPDSLKHIARLFGGHWITRLVELSAASQDVQELKLGQSLEALQRSLQATSAVSA